MSEARRVGGSQLPGWVSGLGAVLNTAGGALRALGAPVDRLSEERLLRAAQRKTGLTDFGDDAFRVPLRTLIRSYDEEHGVTFLARLLIRRKIGIGLVNRLLITNELKQHPEILREVIRKPLVVASMPRTGTTFLHNLLAQDPRARPLLAWEALMPGRRPADIDRKPDPRVIRARRLTKAIRTLAPGLRRIHEIDPEGPEECGMLLQNTFVYAAQPSPIYRDWFLRQPDEVLEAAYREYRMQLQLLQWQRPHDGHWALKAGVHPYAIGALLSVFPDGAIVLIHRDPHRSIPSMCSFLGLVHHLMTDDETTGDPAARGALGPLVLKWAAEGFRRTEAARAHAEPGRVYDMYYHELVTDPLGAVRRMYEHFGYAYTREYEARATAWLREHPQHRHGRHQYEPEQFGLDRRMIDDAVSWYVDQYHIPPESALSSGAVAARPSPA